VRPFSNVISGSPIAPSGRFGQAEGMNETTGLKILAAPGATLILIGVGYAYGLVGGCPRPTPENALPRDATLVAAGILLAGGTARAGYKLGIAKSSSIQR